MNNIPAFFRAYFRVRADHENGPEIGEFRFPENGIRAVPSRRGGVDTNATLAIFYKQNAKIKNGDFFEADCRVAAPEYWAGFIRVGLEFTIWDSRDIIDAKVIKIYTENWDCALTKA